VVLAFWYELDATPRQGLDDPVPDIPANMAVALLGGDMDGAADLEPVDGSPGHAEDVRGHQIFSHRAKANDLPEATQDRIRHFQGAAHARNTSAAYGTQLKLFKKWCRQHG
jgi:hypothetical protein